MLNFDYNKLICVVSITNFGLLYFGIKSVTCNILNLRENEVASGFLLASDGKILSPVAVTNTGWSYNPSYSVIGEERVGIFVPTEKAQEVQTWLNTLSG